MVKGIDFIVFLKVDVRIESIMRRKFIDLLIFFWFLFILDSVIVISFL